MSDSAISGIAFACILGAAFVGMCARVVLPHHHLTSESKDIVKLGTGLIATMAALVLGPFLVLRVFWLAVIFTSFGLFSPNNATVIATLFICSLSVAVAIFLILELDQPFDGLIKISASSVRNALAHLGR